VIDCFVGGWRHGYPGRGRFPASPRKSCLGLLHRPTSVVIRVGFVLGAEISDFPNDFLGVVAAGESTLRICPVCFGLTAVSERHSSMVSGSSILVVRVESSLACCDSSRESSYAAKSGNSPFPNTLARTNQLTDHEGVHFANKIRCSF
jgi:hypothetical protein